MSLSRARFVPRPGTEAPRSSLSRTESRSEPPRFFAETLMFFCLNEASASRRRLLANSRLSSVCLRRRSSRTQSSQLCQGQRYAQFNMPMMQASGSLGSVLEFKGYIAHSRITEDVAQIRNPCSDFRDNPDRGEANGQRYRHRVPEWYRGY